MIWCLHGNVGMAADWDILSDPESPFKGQIIRKVDLWRYQECRSIDLEEFGKVFASEVAAQDEAPVLIGYSMGARLALHALKAAPKLWKSAILMSVNPGLSDESQKVARRKRDAEWSAMALQSDWQTFLQSWNAQAVLGEIPHTLGDRRGLQTRSQAVARAFCSWSLGNQSNMRDALSEVEGEVALMTGGEDEKYTNLSKEIVGSCISRHVVPGAGHRFLWESPSETFNKIAKIF